MEGTKRTNTLTSRFRGGTWTTLPYATARDILDGWMRLCGVEEFQKLSEVLEEGGIVLSPIAPEWEYKTTDFNPVSRDTKTLTNSRSKA